ncbi:MAG: molybdenum cofactor guanylyltransferase MobA [Alphaproteobacteria bacterium]
MPADVVGVLLAGGLARRMGGGDKGSRLLGGRPIIARIIERVRPQVGALILNANGDPGRFAPYGLPVVPDVVEGFAGPLAGVLTGMTWARENVPGATWLASVATDAPFVPRDLVARLRDAAEGQGRKLSCAASGGRTHPVMALWSLNLATALRRALVEEGVRKAEAWVMREDAAIVAFEAGALDPFFNVNTPADLAAAERLIAAHPELAGG